MQFVCTGDLRLTAIFSQNAVGLELPDGRVLAVPLVPSASGARYADSEAEFWNKGRDATLTLRHDIRRDCTEAR